MVETAERIHSANLGAVRRVEGSAYLDMRTVADLLRCQASVRANHVASWFNGGARRWFLGRITTYGELDERSNRIGRALLASGIGRGDRIAYVGMNSDRYFELLFGCAKIGAVIVPVDWTLGPLVVTCILEDCGAKLLFVDELGAVGIESVVPRLKVLQGVVAVEDQFRDWPGFTQWYGAFSAEDPGMVPGIIVEPDDPVIQLYASGVSGSAKGVVLSHSSLLSALFQGKVGRGPSVQWDARDVAFSAIPVFHIGGTFGGLLAYVSGAFSVVSRQCQRSEVFRLLARFGVTKLLLFSGDVKNLLCSSDSIQADLVQLQCVFYFGAPIPLNVWSEAVHTFGCGFCRCYGAAETAGPMAYLLPEDHGPNKGQVMRSAGRLLADAEVRIRKSDDTIAFANEVGYIETRSMQNMTGYWKCPDLPAREVLNKDGWLITGDIGYLDPNGYLFVLSSSKDRRLIVCRGEVVYTAEVEIAFLGHPDVIDASVFGVPHAVWGNVLKAIVVARPGAHPCPVEVLAYVRARVPLFKVPDAVDLVSEIHRSYSDGG